MTSAGEPRSGERGDGGIRASTRRAIVHARSLARLEKELARYELEHKGAIVGAGAGAAFAAAVLALFAVGFGLATLAAALALLVAWWLALLIVFVVLVVAVVVLVLVSRSLFREGTPLRPEQAIEEARLTRQVVGGSGVG